MYILCLINIMHKHNIYTIYIIYIYIHKCIQYIHTEITNLSAVMIEGSSTEKARGPETWLPAPCFIVAFLPQRRRETGGAPGILSNSVSVMVVYPEIYQLHRPVLVLPHSTGVEGRGGGIRHCPTREVTSGSEVRERENRQCWKNFGHSAAITWKCCQRQMVTNVPPMLWTVSDKLCTEDKTNDRYTQSHIGLHRHRKRQTHTYTQA